MDFKIFFAEDTVDLPERALGLDFLDRARQETGIDHLPAEKVENWLSRFSYQPPITITEETARKSPHFRDADSVLVSQKLLDLEEDDEEGETLPLVPVLNRFFYIETVVEKNPSTGEIEKVSPVWKFDAERFLAWWEAEGFPLEIGGEDEE